MSIGVCLSTVALRWIVFRVGGPVCECGDVSVVTMGACVFFSSKIASVRECACFTVLFQICRLC